jgi:uncharacterized protein YkwD
VSGYGYEERPEQSNWSDYGREPAYARGPRAEYARAAYQNQAAPPPAPPQDPWYDEPTGRAGYAEVPRPRYPDERYPDELGDWTDDEPPAKRKVGKVVVIAGAVVALLLVGLVAFAGTILLGGGPSTKNAGDVSANGYGPQLGGPAGTAVPSNGAVPLPSDQAPDPSPSAVVPSAAAPTTPAAKATTKAPRPGNTKNPGGAGLPDVTNLPAENGVLVLVNAERAQAGCKALTVDSRLAAAARKHSADMVARNYFDHTTPDGVEFATRIDNEGYKWSTVGENIAAGQPDATSVMKAWMNSPGHRANILNCKFVNIGIGVAQDGKRPVWTQDFGAPR